jgi:hypothetical protein
MYKTFITIISNNFDSKEYGEIKDFLTAHCFDIEIELPNIQWSAPDQYILEMGQNLETRILLFKESKNENEVVLLKKHSQELEGKYSINNKRRFNINPGFISRDGMYLLSHKPNNQRDRKSFGNYFIEKQYGKDFSGLLPNKNTFSEYLGDRINAFNKIYTETFK